MKRGDRIAEWDPYATPILTEVAGKVKFEDIVDGVSARDEFDEATGISSKVIIDWRSTATRGSDLKPGISVTDSKGKGKTYALPVGAILSVTDGDEVTPGQDLARMPTGGAKTRDITGGLPRVAELFRSAPSEGSRDHLGKRWPRGVRQGLQEQAPSACRVGRREPRAVEYMIPKGKHIPVQEGDFVKKGDYLLDGNPAPQDILSILGVEALANYLVEEIQKVYRLQGVPINDKHIEVIVRQMLQKVEIMESGDTEFLKGEAVEALDLEDENKRVAEAWSDGAQRLSRCCSASPRPRLQTRSFISAASFQETTRVLTEAASYGKSDTLEGLKENVIVGRLIPAGTGGQLRRYQKLAAERDEQLAIDRAEDARLAQPAAAE